jgi:hypothetical protein
VHFFLQDFTRTLLNSCAGEEGIVPSKKLSLYFILFSAMALGTLLYDRLPTLRLPQLGFRPNSTVVVERIPWREARQFGVTYRN